MEDGSPRADGLCRAQAAQLAPTIRGWKFSSMRGWMLSLMISVLIGGLSAAGCGATGGSGSDPSPTPSPPTSYLVGIWNGDVTYLTNNGEPIFSQSVMSSRFEQEGSAWRCVIWGVETSSCTFEGTASSFTATNVLVTTYSTYTRTRTIAVQGKELQDADHLLATFTMTYDYLYTDNTTRQRVYTGEVLLARVVQVDAEVASGLKVIGEFGSFGQGAARVSVTHEESIGESEASHGASSSFKATANVRVDGDHAFLARFGDGLRILDISDPSAIREVGHANPDDVGAWYYNDVKILHVKQRRYALLADSAIGLVVYDVSDPSSPTFVSSFLPNLAEQGDTLNNHTLFVEGTTVYMANYDGSLAFDPEGDGSSGGLLIVDLSDPAHPKELGRWLAREVGGHFTHDLYVENGIAYLACWEAGLVVLDVRTPGQPVVLGQFTYDRMTSHSVWVTRVGERLVAVHGDEDFGSHIRLVDVDPASPSFMRELGAFELRAQVSVHNIMAFGDEVVAAYYQDGVRVLDIQDPSAPEMTAWFNSWRGLADETNGYSFYEGGIGVDVVGERIYLADIWRGLIILERE